MQKNCKQCGINFEVTDEDLQVYKKFTFKIDRKIFEIPPSKLCPDCCAQRRMAFANQINLYKRKCDGTGKEIVSNYSPDKKNIVYDVSYWFSDAWDQFSTGMYFDFSRSFFEQFEELIKIAPRPNLQRNPEYDENADFTNYAGKNKNCYLIFDSDKNRDCYYSYSINSCENTVDCFRSENCEICYECIDCRKCYKSISLQNCTNCNDSAFLKNCISCKNCFGSMNLRSKEFYFLNEKCTKEEYEKKMEAVKFNTFSGLKNMQTKFSKFLKKFPHKYMEGVQNENVFGNYLTNCKNAEYCFDSRNLWDCKFITQAFDNAKDCMNCTEIGDGVELFYESCYSGYNGNSLKFTSHSLGQVYNLTYCYFCPNCSDCFGCFGLRKTKYCIFNKKYTKEEYEQLVPKIIEHMQNTGEWGEFFPVRISPFCYNETHAQDYFPLTKEAVLKRGWKWKENDNTIPKVDKIIPANKLPDDIKDIPDDILNWAIRCEVTNKPYKIIPQELKFYRDHNLPIPRRHPDQRHKDRMSLRNPRKLWSRNCDKCTKEIQTTYSPERPEKVLCEECYLKEVY